MSTSAPSEATQEVVGELLEVMIEVKDTLRQIASAVQTLTTSSD